MKKFRKNLKSRIIFFVLVLFLSSCNLFDKSTKVENFFVMEDIEPPVLQEVQSVSSNQVRLIFSEQVSPIQDTFLPNVAEAEGYSVLVTLTQNVKAGHQIMLYGRVEDGYGNTTGIETPVWGCNADLPKMVINELSTRGEGNNPDRTEILIQSSGSLAGATLYNGIPDSWDSCVIFDDIDVEEGDFIVIWWTEELPENIDKRDHVFNVCAHSYDNLPGYNGIVTLSESPSQGSKVIDCVVYSNFSATYEGYGSKSTLDRVKKAVQRQWWSDILQPIDSTNSTATRTMCRRPGTNQWYICITKGASFGEPNTSEEFLYKN